MKNLSNGPTFSDTALNLAVEFMYLTPEDRDRFKNRQGSPPPNNILKIAMAVEQVLIDRILNDGILQPRG